MGKSKLDRKTFDRELEKLQRELVLMQEWVKAEDRKVCVIFEGRDAAGKGGVIKRIVGANQPACRACCRARYPHGARKRASGTSSDTYPTFRGPARSSCSTARGTTAPASSG